MDFDGKVLLEETNKVDVAPLTSKVYLDWPLKKLTDAGAADTSRVFVVAELTADTTEISRNLAYLAPVKEIHLKPATLKVETAGGNGTYMIHVSFGNLDVKISDNYFNLLPGETVGITAKGTVSLDALNSQLKVISLTDAFATGGQSV
jgi:beta-mannosidase